MVYMFKSYVLYNVQMSTIQIQSGYFRESSEETLWLSICQFKAIYKRTSRPEYTFLSSVSEFGFDCCRLLIFSVIVLPLFDNSADMLIEVCTATAVWSPLMTHNGKLPLSGL